MSERVQGLMAAADRLDVDGFVGHFSADADFHNPIGMVLRGREEIRALHEKLYSPHPPPGFPSFASARATGRVQSVRMVGANVAVVDWAWTQHGGTVDGVEWPDRRGTNTTVWRRDEGGEWRVVVWRDKDFPAGFEPPPGYGA
ncbi:nuclear transport factor 2 family protein [Pseudonocardia acaciae]|uniref:nuclear transport factor 2 family protein n=1 Tax=Pseudonocardia acaciae TaxID=551276 RepID=UPI00055E7CD8